MPRRGPLITRPFSRRGPLKAAVVALALLPLVGGCSSLPSVHGISLGTPTPPASQYQPEPARHEGGTLVVGDWESPTNFSPLFNEEVPAAQVDALLFASLARGGVRLKDVTDLEGTVCVQGNTGEEISQRVLQGKAYDYAEDRGRGENCTELHVGVERFEDEDEKNSECYQRKDVTNQGGRFVTAAKAKGEVKNGRVDHAHAEVSKHGPKDQRRDLEDIRMWMPRLKAVSEETVE